MVKQLIILHSGDGDIENGDGISHRKEGGLKLEFNWEKQKQYIQSICEFSLIKYIYLYVRFYYE